MYIVIKLVAVIALHINLVVGQLYKGDACQFKNGNGYGICKLITECPEAIDNIRKQIYPQQCGFEGRQVIVCCAQEKPSVTPKPITSTTTPAKVITSRSPGEISNQKCLEYSQYVWKIELNPTLIIGGGDIKTNVCPFHVQDLVVGGTPATRREFPHMMDDVHEPRNRNFSQVQFGYDASDGRKWTCGGTLISDQYVLSAAHCLSDRSFGDAKYARMGIIDLDDDDHMQQFNIEERIPYPEFEEPSHYHDIGLAKLQKKAELNTWVRPSCLYTTNKSPWSKVIASGWGKTAFAGSESNVLLRVILELYNQPQCNETFKNQIGTNKLMEGIKDETMICAGHSKELRDTCQGDSGGPLQVYRTGQNMTCMYDVVGVTSFGQACGIGVNIPAVYTRVSNYIKWIEDIVWPPT